MAGTFFQPNSLLLLSIYSSVMKKVIYIICACYFITSCRMTNGIEKKRVKASVTLPTKLNLPERAEYKLSNIQTFTEKGKKISYARTEKDSTGNKRITVQLSNVTVVARSKSVPERNGKINLDFVVKVPRDLLSTNWMAAITPIVLKGDRKIQLKDIAMNGKAFIEYQKKGSQIYNLLQRRYELFKRDSLRIGNYYNYKYNLKVTNAGARLDTIIKKPGSFEYYYTQQIKADDDSKKINLCLAGRVFAIDKSTYTMPVSDTISYIVSSMVQFLDLTPHFKRVIIERKATSSLKSYITFPSGGKDVDEKLGENQNEIQKVQDMISKITSTGEFLVDSISLNAGCSPEGSYKKNMSLSKERSLCLKQYLKGKLKSIDGIDTMLIAHANGENWQELNNLITSSSVFQKQQILSVIGTKANPDEKEFTLRNKFPASYKDIVTRFYPRLRSVDFTFFVHRKGMIKDTIHTTEPDTLYAHAIELMQKRRYSKALQILNEYQDWNTGICLMSLGYDEKAYELFKQQSLSANTEYLLAILAARLGKEKEAYERYIHSCKMDESKKWRGALDPEINQIINKYNLSLK
jgi:hypothetical protein